MFLTLLLFSLSNLIRPKVVTQKSNGIVNSYTTTADQSKLFEETTINFDSQYNENAQIIIDKNTKYQQMDGFGAAITGSTAYNLLQMSETNRKNLLQKIFDPVNGMGYSFIRISIGCSDFSLEDYTYCDTEGIENFAIHDLDKRDLIPILQEIIKINPEIKIVASPWTPPKWMKTSSTILPIPHPFYWGGYLGTSHYNDYATYFVKYIQSMKEYGINIDFITVQNEPLNKGNSASCYMSYKEQRDFVKEALGPAFKKNTVSTKILIYDHNYNYDDISSQQHYPVLIYDDAEAAQYIYGSAWHAYGGDKSELDYVREAYPDKALYFTEISIGEWSYTFDSDLMWNMREVCLGTVNKGTKGVLVWNLMLDDNHGPYRSGGCDNCYGAIDISSSDYSTLTYRSHYYTMAHMSKVAKHNSYRIGNNGYSEDGFYYSTFVNPDNTLAIVLQNDTDSPKSITIGDGSNSFTVQLPNRSIVSLHW